MMDFLKSLAPSRRNDAGRAVAVLPSRFESAAPLRSAAVQADREREEAEDALEPDARPPRRVVRVAAEPSDDAAGHEGARDSGSAPRHGATAEPAARIAPGTERPAYVSGRTWQQTDRAAAPRADVTEVRRAPTSAMPARDEYTPSRVHERASTPGRTRAAATSTTAAAPESRSAPLSEAAVAQRSIPAHEPDTVVEVSIGRIEVLALDAPKPEPARAARPRRQPSVALSDYLRREPEGAR